MSTQLESPRPPATTGHGRPPKLVLYILAIVLAAFACYFIWTNFFKKAPENAVFVSGRIEGYETDLSPKVGGRVDFVALREGNLAKRGQLVAQLSDEDLKAQLRAAESRIRKAGDNARRAAEQLTVVRKQMDQAEMRLSQARETSRGQIAEADARAAQADARVLEANANLSQAQSSLDLARIRLSRFTALVKKGAVTKDEYDQAQATFLDAGALVEARKASVKAALKESGAAEAALTQARSSRFDPGVRKEDVSVLTAQLNQASHDLDAANQEVTTAKAQRDEVLANLAYLKIESPIDGVVTARTAEPGEVVTPGQPVLSIIDLSRVYLRGYVPEGQIGKVFVGQKTKVYIDAFPNQPFSGRVIEIDPVGSFTPENIYFKDDRVKQVFGIKVGFDEPKGLAKPGMPADAEILL